MILLLAIIYLAFIALGLPDSLIGSAWPVMHVELGAPISAVGIFTMMTCSLTILTSLFTGVLLRRFGTGKVTAVSVMLTAVALVGIYFAPNYIVVCALALPLGAGAGAIDSSLNAFVAAHYRAIHMNWLHCFWGVGATVSPLIMAVFLGNGNGWRNGYLAIAVMLSVVSVVLFCSLPLWTRAERREDASSEKKAGFSRDLLRLPGIKEAILALFCYCTVEQGTGLLAAIFLVTKRGVTSEAAAGFASLFYIGITVGRFVTGLFSLRLSNKRLIRIGNVVVTAGIVLLFVPNATVSEIGLVTVGLGCAPIFPAMLHETPVRFGQQNAQMLMGIQMASAYVGIMFMPLIIGFIGEYTDFILLPCILMVFAIITIIASERTFMLCGRKAE